MYRLKHTTPWVSYIYPLTLTIGFIFALAIPMDDTLLPLGSIWIIFGAPLLLLTSLSIQATLKNGFDKAYVKNVIIIEFSRSLLAIYLAFFFVINSSLWLSYHIKLATGWGDSIYEILPKFNTSLMYLFPIALVVNYFVYTYYKQILKAK